MLHGNSHGLAGADPVHGDHCVIRGNPGHSRHWARHHVLLFCKSPRCDRQGAHHIGQARYRWQRDHKELRTCHQDNSPRLCVVCSLLVANIRCQHSRPTSQVLASRASPRNNGSPLAQVCNQSYYLHLWDSFPETSNQALLSVSVVFRPEYPRRPWHPSIQSLLFRAGPLWVSQHRKWSGVMIAMSACHGIMMW